MENISKYIQDRISSRGNPDKAKWLENYVKHDIKSKGVGIPELRQIVLDAEKEHALTKRGIAQQTGIMRRTIDAWIDIDAQPEKVWEVLMDFKSWESWNGFIPLVEGNLRVGETLRIKVVSPGMKPMIFKPKVFVVDPGKEILWGGSFLKILYRGDHAFRLEPLPDGKTRFRQIERFMGPVVLFMGDMIKKTELGYHQMNLALKNEVERRNLPK